MLNTVGDVEQANIFVYIEMPLLVKYGLLKEKKLEPNIFCGPAVSIKTLAMNDVGVLDNINGIRECPEKCVLTSNLSITDYILFLNNFLSNLK